MKSLRIVAAVVLSTYEPALVAEPPALREMNPFVLTNLVSSSLVVEIDWVEGALPSPTTVDAIGQVLSEHCSRGKRIDVRPDDEIPRSTWLAAPHRTGLEQLVARFLDGDPSDWRRTELLYVLLVPRGGSWYEDGLSGMTDRITFERGGRVATVRTVFLFTDEIRRDATLWVTRRKVERATIIHELGHVLGLVGNPDHEQSRYPGHCRSARCVMHRPGFRAALVNGLPAFFAGRIPIRFGARCRKDIEEAKRAWAQQAARSSGFADELITERLLREKRDAEAWKRLRRP